MRPFLLQMLNEATNVFPHTIHEAPTKTSHGKINFNISILTTILKFRKRKESTQPCVRSP